MMFNVYSIRDSLSGFMTPTIEQNDAIAMRNFSMALDKVNSDRSIMAFRPSDFSLCCIATFDSISGIVNSVSPIRLVCNGSSIGGSKDDSV